MKIELVHIEEKEIAMDLKLLFIALIILASGCASVPPPPSCGKGDFRPVNPETAALVKYKKNDSKGVFDD